MIYTLYASTTHRTWLLYQISIESAHSPRYHNKYTKCMKKVATITQIWHRAKCYLIHKHEQRIVSDSCIKYEQTTFSSGIVQQTLNIYENKIVKFGQIVFYMTEQSLVLYLIIVPNMKTIHPAIMKECARIGWETDGRTLSYISRFRLCWLKFYLLLITELQHNLWSD